MDNDYEELDQTVNRWFCAEYLARTYATFMFQMMLSALYVLHPGVWWISIQVSLITSPLVVNVWNPSLLRLFYPFELAGLLAVEFSVLQYFTYTRDIATSLLGLIITFGLISLLYLFTYFSKKVIVLDLAPTKTVMLFLNIAITSYFKNRVVFNINSYVKYMLIIHYILRHSCIIQPTDPQETVNASIKVHVSFILILMIVMTIVSHA